MAFSNPVDDLNFAVLLFAHASTYLLTALFSRRACQSQSDRHQEESVQELVMARFVELMFASYPCGEHVFESWPVPAGRNRKSREPQGYV